jgi:HTH-type transcriptional regulator, competence development regulator
MMEMTMSFGVSVRQKRIADGIGLNEFADRLGVSPAYWSRVEREQENPPRDEYVEKAAAILGVRMDDLFVEAGRLPPDMREDLKQVVQVYRRRKQVKPA